jgi:hypothetical protein
LLNEVSRSHDCDGAEGLIKATDERGKFCEFRDDLSNNKIRERAPDPAGTSGWWP